MADGNGRGRFTVSGIAFGVLLLILIVVSLWLFIARPWWFPTLVSVHGADIDSVFGAVLLVTGIAFVLVHLVLGWFVARYGSKGSERAEYWHDNPKAEAILLIGTAVILTVLVFMGQRVWANMYFSEKPANAMTVQVTGQQFNWVFHYPGADGIFGRRDNALTTSTNDLGLDRNDPAAKDDVVSLNNFHIPVNRPVVVQLRSKDVIHSFFLPNLRVKQDAVPGLAVEVWFTATEVGTFEIACAELCGLGHYRMKGALTIESEEAMNTWLQGELAAQ